jgi:ParB-like chromosome segregation protein Spo0J
MRGNNVALSAMPTIIEQSSQPLQIAYRPLRELEPYARNARKHTAKQIAKLRASLRRFGWTNPMLTAGREMIAGHGRLAAAIAMAEANDPIAGNDDPWSGPTVDLSHLPPADRRAYRIADNRIALDAGWDNDLLRLEMGDLKLDGFNLDLTGFGDLERRTLLNETGEGRRQLGDGLQYQVVVNCTDERHQAELLTAFRAQGLGCKPVIL